MTMERTTSALGATTRIAYHDTFVDELYEDIGRLISGESTAATQVESRLRELARTNSEATATYWRAHEAGLGVPDSAYKATPPYLFPDQEPVRTFHTSNTTGSGTGRVPYTARGMDLMDMSILRNAGRHIMHDQDEPAVIRLVPSERSAPGMIMAHGMELIARRFGHPRLSGCVLRDSGIDHSTLFGLLNMSVAEQQPVVLIGATSLFVNLCQSLRGLGKSWELPSGSRLVDAGGHKRTRQVTVEEIRTMAAEVFGIAPGGHRNLFGMTELASQLYDADDTAAGPSGERPKGSETFVRAQVRAPADLTLLDHGVGLLEVVDLCILDRPCAVLTGDWGLAGPTGTAVIGRVAEAPREAAHWLSTRSPPNEGTMSEPRCVSWVPSWLDVDTLQRADIPAHDDVPHFFGLRPKAGGWQSLGDGLRAAHEALHVLPIAQIIDVFDRTCIRWADREFTDRVRARQDIVAATGFSPEAVDRSLDVELGNYRAETLNRVLRRELGDPEVLEGFRTDAELDGRTRAIGPRVTIAVCSGNVPGLPALSIVRALLVKSAVLVKVASGEPSFAAHFLRSLAEVNPVLADAVFVTYWPNDDHDALRDAVAQADAVIAYGGDDACAAVRAHVGRHQRYVEHGHKVSVGVITQAYLGEIGLREVARRVAEDVSTFNQHACIAPAAYLVECGEPSPHASAHAVAEALAHAMAAYAADCPLGSLPPADAAALQMRRASAAWTAANSSAGGFWRALGLDWTVAMAPDLLSVHGSGNRMVGVVPVTGIDDIVRELQPIASHLQNVGLGAVGAEFWALASKLGRLGACRISEPGRMASPSVIWRHDGMPCLSLLLRWCDIEMHQEARAHATFSLANDR
jgi:Acyl-CoA reductase (LuxC)